MTDRSRPSSDVPDAPLRPDTPASEDRRKTLGKLAYASPILAGLLFSSTAANAQSFGGGGIGGPPPAPGS